MTTQNSAFLNSILARLQNRKNQIQHEQWKEGEILVSKDELKVLKSAEEQDLRHNIVPLLVEIVTLNDMRWGFVRPIDNCSIDETLKKIADAVKLSSEQHEYSSLRRVGLSTIRARFMSYWHAAHGPATLCQNEKVLTEIIKYRIGINKSEDSKEMWDFMPETLRRGFISSRKVVSIFKPVTAAQIYAEHLDMSVFSGAGAEKRKPVVWDPSAGFGSRMLGFASVCPGGIYIANEPAAMTRADLLSLSKELPIQVKIMAEGSEVVGPSEPVDLVFTSPPYFDKEKYFDEPGQCWRDYKSAQEWTESYVWPTIRKAAGALRPGGKLIINIDHENKDIFMSIAHRAGLQFLNQYNLIIGKDHFAKANAATSVDDSAQSRSEPILVFQKTSNVISVDVEGTHGRYAVTDAGDVISYAKSAQGKLMSGHEMASGYMTVGLYDQQGDCKTTLVHRIVCKAFHGDPPSSDHADVRHLDGNKKNNRADNLAWGTRSENMLDVVKHKKESISDNSHSEAHAKTLNWYAGFTSNTKLVNTCIELFMEKKLRISDIARLLDCSQDVAYNLVHGRTGSHMTTQTVAPQQKRSPERIAAIHSLIAEGKTREEVNTMLDETLNAQAFYYYKTKMRVQ